MTRWTLPVLALIACTVSSSETPEGGRISLNSSDHAPWDMGGDLKVMWATDPGNDGRSGEGVLMITTGDQTCEDMRNFYDLEQTLADGTGLIFLLEYWTDRDREASPPAWDGLYMGGYGYSLDDSEERSMVSAGFHDGTLYMIGGYYGGGWLRVDEGTNESFRGEFDTEYWWGAFDAELCGELQGEYYYYYDYEYYYDR